MASAHEDTTTSNAQPSTVVAGESQTTSIPTLTNPQSTADRSGQSTPSQSLNEGHLKDEEHHGQRSQSPPAGPMRVDTTTALAQAQSPPPAPAHVTSSTIARTISSAIGPSSDQVAAAPVKEEETAGPQLQLTLLLTNGARHPFMLDAKYLARRSVEVQDNDPFNLSVYKLKELILREWRDEWEQKPTNPSYIRLISFGRLLDDKSALKDNRFNPEQSNVVHMTIKPQEFGDEDEGKGGKTAYAHAHDATEGRSPGCRCAVM